MPNVSKYVGKFKKMKLTILKIVHKLVCTDTVELENQLSHLRVCVCVCVCHVYTNIQSYGSAIFT